MRLKLNEAALLVALLVSYAVFPAGAQTDAPVRQLMSRAADAAVSFSYSYLLSGPRISAEGTGEVTFQDNAFHAMNDGMEIYSDGETRWTIDRRAKEAVTENQDSYSDDLLSNPALVVRNALEYFEIASSSEDSFRGKAVTRVDMTPASSVSGISSLSLFFSPTGSSLAGFVAETSDGIHAEIEITAMSFSSRVDISSFRFDESTLGDDWVVTDLR